MKKDYFNLEDVAKQLRCEVSDLLHYAAKDELTLSVLMAGERATLHIWDSNPMESEDALDITEADAFSRDALGMKPQIVEELFGPFPLSLRAAKELEAGRLHEINEVSDCLQKEEFSEWRLLNPLKSTGIKIVVAAEELRKFRGSDDLTNEAAATREWKKQAWNLGTEWMNGIERKTGKRPTVEEIAKHLEGELSERKITGKRGKFLDRETIKREALTGITGRKQGENLINRRGNPP